MAGVKLDNSKDNTQGAHIFISYNWAEQSIVQQIKDRLKSEGYSVWMDIDSLSGSTLESMATAVLGSAVVLIAMSEKYKISMNCRTEAEYAYTLGKPLIPLMVQKRYNPDGWLGILTGTRLYVNFTKEFDQAFQHLLKEIKPHVNAAVKTAEKTRPATPKKQEQAKEAPKKQPKSIEPTREKLDVSQTGADVFISYQWDKQKDIKDLYQTLKGRGFSCWMDISKMGGGDELDLEIDKGIRGCKVFIACVSKRYPASENCCKEVALARRIKKPIIPLVLEPEMKKWPPEGRMSLAFVELLYIDFSKPAIGKKIWEGSNADDLFQKITIQIGTKSNDTVSVKSQQPIKSCESDLSTCDVAKWTKNQVKEWISACQLKSKLNAKMKGLFDLMDGKLLVSFCWLKKEVPEYFINTLRQQYDADMVQIMYLLTALRELPLPETR